LTTTAFFAAALVGAGRAGRVTAAAFLAGTAFFGAGALRAGFALAAAPAGFFAGFGRAAAFFGAAALTFDFDFDGLAVRLLVAMFGALAL
jgi:hypothetical protein